MHSADAENGTWQIARRNIGVDDILANPDQRMRDLPILQGCDQRGSGQRRTAHKVAKQPAGACRRIAQIGILRTLYGNDGNQIHHSITLDELLIYLKARHTNVATCSAGDQLPLAVPDAGGAGECGNFEVSVIDAEKCNAQNLTLRLDVFR